jgi:hypothetical protein
MACLRPCDAGAMCWVGESGRRIGLTWVGGDWVPITMATRRNGGQQLRTTQDPAPVLQVPRVGTFDEYIVLTRKQDAGKIATAGLVYWRYPYDGSSLPRLAYFVTQADRDKAAAKLGQQFDYQTVALPSPRLIVRPVPQVPPARRKRLTSRIRRIGRTRK